MKFRFYYLLAFSAFLLSSTAAYFSVTGLAKLFHGAYWSIIIMAGSLELSKLVSLSFLYRYWDDLNKAFRFYLMAGTIVLMIITSAGIYGFLSSAYSVTSDKLENMNGQLELLEKKKTIMEETNQRLQQTMHNKTERINALNSIRANQESRIDTLYQKGFFSGVKKTEQIIKNADQEIEKLTVQIDDINFSIQNNSDSISRIDIAILGANDSNLQGEIGPLKFISELTGKPVGTIVNFFILLLIFVFDPLAIVLVIATNMVLMKEKSSVDYDGMFEFLNKNPTKRPSDYLNQ
jgi:hypothetical protein